MPTNKGSSARNLRSNNKNGSVYAKGYGTTRPIPPRETNKTLKSITERKKGK